MLAPGRVRDAIVEYLGHVRTDKSTTEIHQAVVAKLVAVGPSSVRSYLQLNTPRLFERTGRGRYRLQSSPGIRTANSGNDDLQPAFVDNLTKLYHADCFDWLARRPDQSIHAVITDPPYGLVEYTEKEQAKLRQGRGGVWRIPPSFDGHQRSPLPRFTTLDKEDREELRVFFKRLAIQLRRVTVPGANILVASNPLLAHIVAGAMSDGGLELRGYIARLVMTMRGGDRPKNAHLEFPGVSVMPRSMWEPWVVLRNPLEGRVQDNLRKWNTAGFRRPSADRPFGDVIRSAPTTASERKIAPHPSLKPQAVLRQLVRASLPLGEGVVLDPFAGSGSTLAAACAVGYPSIGCEMDERYVHLAAKAIPRLAGIAVSEQVSFS
jgi:DNA modification methylase